MKLSKSTKILLIIWLGVVIIFAILIWPGKLINHFANKTAQNASLVEQASAKMGEDKYDEAKPIYEEVVKNDPNNASAWVNLGICELSAKNYPAAISDFEKALSISPTSSVYVLLGNAERDNGEQDKAIENYKKALAINKNELNGCINLASLYYTQGQSDLAISTLKTGKENLPQVMEIRYMLASYYKNLGQTANYNQEIKEILAINPNDKWALANK